MGFMLKKPVNEPGAAWPAIVIGLFVAFGGVLFGYDTGTISGILGMRVWQNLFAQGNIIDGQLQVSSDDESLVVSILSLGTFLGALTAAPVADLLGRRWGLIASTAIIFNLGVALQVAATDQPLFIAGRFFAGFGVGLVSAMSKYNVFQFLAEANVRQVPLYQSETSPKWIRGTIVGAYQLAITIGLFLAAIVNNATKSMTTTAAYRIPLAVQFAWSLILTTGMLMLPETPRFEIKRGNNEKAAKSLAKLRRLSVDHPGLVEELAEIRANHEYETNVGQGSYLHCFKGTIGKRLITGCALQALQQLSGVNFIFYYGTSYFERSGFSDPFIIQVVTNTVNVVSTFPGLYLVEEMGRRNLLLMGAVGMTVCQFIVAATGTAAESTNLSAQRSAIAFVCLYIFFFASSWGPVAWVVTGELFPLQVRAKCLSMTTATNWLLNFVIAYVTPLIVNPDHANLGSKVFFIWGSCCALSIFFVYFFIYETKGLALEQVDELYALINKAWRSKEFRPQVSYRKAQADGLNQGHNLRQMSLAQSDKPRSRADDKDVGSATSELE